MDKWLGNRNGKQRLITSIFEFVGGGFQCAVLLRVNRRTAAMKIFRYFRDGLLATDRLERHRAFPGRRNAVCRDLLESHFYREPGCRNDNSFILTKNLPTPTDDCSLQMNHPQKPTDPRLLAGRPHSAKRHRARHK